MPVMSNWPGPNWISPSGEEHAATDGENLVKSENTSTEDVVLVQPLDNLPEQQQQQQQQQQQRPDYPVLSGIMCDWERRTESRGSCDSGVSFKSDRSRELGIDFKKRSPFRRRTESRGSCDSGVSFKSDRSRELGIDFKKRSPFRRRTESRGSCDSGVSFKSDRSRELGIDFKKRSPFSPEQLLRPDYPVHRMPVMSNWPGPNCISPSVEEHAATDGENLVKSENTSTEDVVLVQSLDNLPEQQQQQQQQQKRPDYPVLSGIMCDWERRTESRGSCDSGVSFKSDRSRELGIDFKKRSPFSPEQLLRPDYPVHRMPVMSNWPGPNWLSPSVEEHAATDGENLVKSENTSTEDVVLVQPLDNLPEQQQQQQQQQQKRPDYPVLSGIMCDWERRTESRGSCDSGVSFKSDRSRELGIDFKKRSPFRRRTESRGSCDSGVSFKSDRSRELGIDFKKRSPFSPEQLLRPDYPVHRMPVMSNWPGPNWISPSVEEHAATDGENLVKSENTSTEDVVLVQPLDNLPEQQQQQQQQQQKRPDYPVLSGIMCDWERRTESRGSCDSGVSFKSDRSRELGIDFKKRSPFRRRTESRGSCDSGVSFKSDRSRELGIDFKKRSPFRRRTESRGSCDSGVSFKSDRSRELGIDFKKRSPFSPEQLLRPDYPVHRMPVMSNWPGPNCISPSVEEHAATDGENLVKSENTSTEDVVLVQPLDNLPEQQQQQQQQQQQRPDYPVLSGIMCDWERRTESRGSCDSGVSFKSDRSKEFVIDFKKRSPFRH